MKKVYDALSYQGFVHLFTDGDVEYWMNWHYRSLIAISPGSDVEVKYGPPISNELEKHLTDLLVNVVEDITAKSSHKEEIDLRICSPGQKLIARDGSAFTYFSRVNYHTLFEHMVCDKNGMISARTHDGKTFHTAAPFPKDIVGIEIEQTITVNINNTKNIVDLTLE